MCRNASSALASLVGRVEMAKALAMCEQNSTAIPTVMTRLTKDKALSVILQKYIMPNILTKIIAMVAMTMTAVQRSNPSKTKVIIKIAAPLRPRLKTVLGTRSRYCS